MTLERTAALYCGKKTTWRDVQILGGLGMFSPTERRAGSRPSHSMNGDLPAERRCTRSRTSRLSRSLRVSQPGQLEPPQPVTEFRTPSRLHRCRPAESPLQESDCQQDIVWDATSPSPRRSGNRGKKQATRGVNISEIVSRIAPKHGRPAISEPALQQWIGDSATIPCTPDLQAPKPRKSPRSCVVDDLLRLAKQFDLNMFRPDEAEPPLSPELLSDDVVESVNHRTEVQLAEVDDLDFLFDGPTQHVSGRISQPSQIGPSAAKPPISSTALDNVEIQDDWEDDDLFNESLVLENFTSPIVCSTQKPLAPNGHVRHQNPSPVKLFQSASGRLSRGKSCSSESPPALKLAHSAADKENLNPRTLVESESELRLNKVPAQCGVSQRAGALSEPLLTTRDALLDDLDSLFSAEPLWDDPEDDDLLCQLCEDLERQIHPNVLSSDQRVAPPTPFKEFKTDTTNAPSRGPTLPGATMHINTTGESVRVVREVSGAGKSESLKRGDRIPTPTQKGRFSFKKPNKPVSTVTSTVSLRCSDAEIQMKKQQAMERRRQRLQAATGWN